jgi:transglutaminase-like putative cysteine protease
MPKLTIKHITTYHYKRPVAFGEHFMMLRPRDSHDQRLLDAKLVITPRPAGIRRTHDAFDNHVDIASFAGRAKELRFAGTFRVEHSHINIEDLRIEEFARSFPFIHSANEMPDLIRFVERQSFDPECHVERWTRTFLRKGGPTDTRDFLIHLTHRIWQAFTHVRRDEKGIQTPLQTLQLGSGSCRDLAVLMIDAVRSLGMAARFVSGYLYIPAEDEAGHVGGGNTHAWAQVYLPGPGWVDFDPSNGLIGNRDLIRVAVVRDPRWALPLYGTWTGIRTDFIGMNVEVAVTSESAKSKTPVPHHD